MNIAVAEFLDDLRGGRMEEAPVVKVSQGHLQGKISNTPSGKAFYSFQGIPYAKPPLGSLRFKDPVPAEPWEGIRDASSEGSISSQLNYKDRTQSGDENCLFLNVYTPNLDGSFLPVMVFIHGGGLRLGSGNTSSHGADYLVEKDVVVVTLNYRLGALGFLCLNTPEVPGNAGLKDQALALQWVKENIHNFGGNSGNVTVFGQSAGGVCASVLTASPLTKNEISKVIIQSGVGIGSWAWQHTPLDNAKELAKQLGCESTDADDVLNFLQSTSVKDIIEAAEAISPLEKLIETRTNKFSIVIEKEFPGVKSIVNESFLDLLTTGRIAEIPVLTGVTDIELALKPTVDDLRVFIPAELHIERNSDEALAIDEKLKQLYFNGEKMSVENWPGYFKLVSDAFFVHSHHRYIKHLTQVSNKSVYYYNFAYVGSLNVAQKMGFCLDSGAAAHCDELGYLFRCDLNEDAEPTSQDVKTRERMISLWTNFAKTGNPTPEENHTVNITWQPVTKDTEYYLNIGSELSLETGLHKDRMAYWDDLYKKHFKIWEHPRSNANEIPVKNIPNVEVTEDLGCEDVGEFEEEIKEVEKKENGVSEAVDDADIGVKTVETVVEETKSEVIEKFEETNSVVEKIEETHSVVEKIEETNSVVVEKVEKTSLVEETRVVEETPQNGHVKTGMQNGDARKVRPSNEIKMVQSNGAPKDVIRANDPPEDDLPKNIGVNKFVNFFESLGGKK